MLDGHEVNKLNNFISGWYYPDTSFCDDFIEYFQTANNKHEGWSSDNPEDKVDKSRKDSLDCFLDDTRLKEKYDVVLQDCVDEYIKQYSYSAAYGPWNVRDLHKIQYYKPGGHYIQWHTERFKATEPYVSRYLVYITYLNDVTDEGETEFFYQKLKVKPQKGLTIIWPADWMFTHRGLPSPTQDKYIVTGWFNLV